MLPVLAQVNSEAIESAKTIVELDVTVMAFLAGSVMPLATALVAKFNASSVVKGVLNLCLSMAAGVLVAFQANDGKLTLIEIAGAAIAAYLASGTAYQNLWKPTGIAPAVQRATRNFGLGTGAVVETTVEPATPTSPSPDPKTSEGGSAFPSRPTE